MGSSEEALAMALQQVAEAARRSDELNLVDETGPAIVVSLVTLAEAAVWLLRARDYNRTSALPSGFSEAQAEAALRQAVAGLRHDLGIVR